MADLENFVPVKTSTVLRTASIAKPVTATAAMQLVEAGRLDLDAPVEKYVPEFPRKPWPVTMRQLLGHLGGIRSYRDQGESLNTRHFSTLRDAVRVFAADDLASEPGTRYTYSSLGFVLAGAVVEAVAGFRLPTTCDATSSSRPGCATLTLTTSIRSSPTGRTDIRRLPTDVF